MSKSNDSISAEEKCKKLQKKFEMQNKLYNAVSKSFDSFEDYANVMNKFQQKARSVFVYEAFQKSTKLATKIAMPSSDVLKVAALTTNLIAQNSQLFEYVNKINDIFRNLVPKTPVWLLQEKLAQSGWVIPINKKEFNDFDYSSFNVDEDIVAYYEKNNGNLLRSLQQEIFSEISYLTHKNQFNEAVKSYDAGLYHACVYSLSPIIEGMIANKVNPTSIKIKESFNNMTEELQKGLIKDPKVRLFMLLKTYLEECYAVNIPFKDDEPDNINRHWISHGKYKNKEMTKTDCLKLFSALYAMTKVVRFCQDLEDAA